MALSNIADSAERIVYRVAGLPVAVRVLLGNSEVDEGDLLQSVFASRYWRLDSFSDWFELIIAAAISPLAVMLASVWFTLRNGRLIRDRFGKGIAAQLLEQLQLYFLAGVLPPWYYIFSLHERGSTRVGTFIQRFETKRCLFPMLKPKKGTPLNDKSDFASYCANHGIRCVETLLALEGKRPQSGLPACDLFVKPRRGRGGRGAERWDLVDSSTFVSPAGERLQSEVLLRRLVARSRHTPLIVQPRMKPHLDLLEITAGALPTVRVLTCLNELHEPEVMAAMLRTSFGLNVTVDNLHAGGIGALVNLNSGQLSRGSNLGSSARLGWFSIHPDKGARIEDRTLPYWEQVKADAVAAHNHFMDRVVIGWDIAILDDGPIFIEGNGNPDLDILQRFMHIGLRQHRFADLLKLHIRERSLAAPRIPWHYRPLTPPSKR